MEDSLGDAEAPVAKEEASRPSKEFRLPAEKPILAKDGSNILLRFSQLFAEAGEAIRWHSNIVARSLVGVTQQPCDCPGDLCYCYALMTIDKLAIIVCL